MFQNESSPTTMLSARLQTRQNWDAEIQSVRDSCSCHPKLQLFPPPHRQPQSERPRQLPAVTKVLFVSIEHSACDKAAHAFSSSRGEIEKAFAEPFKDSARRLTRTCSPPHCTSTDRARGCLSDKFAKLAVACSCHVQVSSKVRPQQISRHGTTNFPAGHRRAAVRTYHGHGLDIAVIAAEHGGNLDHRLHGATIKQAVFDGFVSRNKARP